MGFQIWPWSANRISKARHDTDLVREGFYTLNIDAAQAGLGGTEAWSEKGGPLSKYRLTAPDYEFYLFFEGFKL